MTNEEQNIIIAEACGWVKRTQLIDSWEVTDYNGGGEYCSVPTSVYVKDDKIILLSSIPLYTDDLNAMHIAEKELTITLPAMPYTASQRTRYVNYLEEACGDKGMVMATSSQRAEAFLRTLGKWSE